ncbi:aspartate racemase [Aequitasia blattaphilus]|uniref:Amino acid racemase n=1 Tax=Aequitasia blattaphilus TaxID=2949332 RepID=A0ABT1EE95_9FIRM|nr:amino acid racemase [Aequitasia blattaphilus]MCP1103161.1 amino acid racemase [Aequitasia blattaphilus]MCR8615801.1 amino acid racemase [Aequitasia blattaphilus]
MKKKLGVIGGMGPEATSYFYEEVIAHTKAHTDQEHINMVILSHATMPDRTKAILTGKSEVLIEKLVKDAKILEKLGVANIGIPCNTSHYFFDQVQQEVAIPIIHMPRESVKSAIRSFDNVRKIGIMGTDGTIEAGVYHKECESLGVLPVSPSKERQKDVMSLIYDDIKSGKKGDKKKFNRAFEELVTKGCDVVILACTELSVFKRNFDVSERCIDAMDTLIYESIVRSGAKYVE